MLAPRMAMWRGAGAGLGAVVGSMVGWVWKDRSVGLFFEDFLGVGIFYVW
jgi:hypothetical protein